VGNLYVLQMQLRPTLYADRMLSYRFQSSAAAAASLLPSNHV